MKKKFELLLLKNTLAIALPAIAVFVMLMVLLLRYPILSNEKCTEINDIKLEEQGIDDIIQELVKAEKLNVRMTASKLYYTGFDYVENGKAKGSYYYTMNDNRLRLYLIKSDKPEDLIESYSFKGRIISDKVSTEHIMNQLARLTGMDSGQISSYCSDFIISELDYPRVRIALIYIFYALPLVICFMIMAYNIVVWIRPSYHSQSRQLSCYGDIKEVIRELDMELKDNVIYKQSNICITDNYLIVSYLTKTDIVRIDMIKYLSKNKIEKKNSFGKKVTAYRITMSTPDLFFYEVDFGLESLCDDVYVYVDSMQR